MLTYERVEPALARPLGARTVERKATEPLVGRARIAVMATLGCVGFSYAYMVLHALHVLKRDPGFTARLSSIPLFQTCLGASVCGVLASALGACVKLGGRWTSRLPTLLALTIAVFVVEILLFP